MLLYLVRHGIAEDTPPSGGDPERRLTQEGTLRTAMVAKGLKRTGATFDRIITSPYVRARQTAEIIARVTEYEDDIDHDVRLTPFGRPEQAADLVREHRDAASLLLTGHEPSMGEFISAFCAGGNLQIEVKKASVTVIRIDRLAASISGTLLWSLPPGILEKLAR
jgi:phosphohistidine phosphatase